jgi:hypothetical protein
MLCASGFSAKCYGLRVEGWEMLCISVQRLALRVECYVLRVTKEQDGNTRDS